TANAAANLQFKKTAVSTSALKRPQNPQTASVLWLYPNTNSFVLISFQALLDCIADRSFTSLYHGCSRVMTARNARLIGGSNPNSSFASKRYPSKSNMYRFSIP